MKKKSATTRSGLLAGGNWIIDQVKMIDVYPQPEQLANIRSQSQGTGGAPYNVLIDLARSGAPFPLFAAGLVGQDALGEHILATCRQYKIDVQHLGTTPKAPDLLHRRDDRAGPRAAHVLSCPRRQRPLARRRFGLQEDQRAHLSPGLPAPARRAGRAGRPVRHQSRAPAGPGASRRRQDQRRRRQRRQRPLRPDRQPRPQARGLLHPQRDRGGQDHRLQDPAAGRPVGHGGAAACRRRAAPARRARTGGGAFPRGRLRPHAQRRGLLAVLLEAAAQVYRRHRRRRATPFAPGCCMVCTKAGTCSGAC